MEIYIFIIYIYIYIYIYRERERETGNSEEADRRCVGWGREVQ